MSQPGPAESADAVGELLCSIEELDDAQRFRRRTSRERTGRSLEHMAEGLGRARQLPSASEVLGAAASTVAAIGDFDRVTVWYVAGSELVLANAYAAPGLSIAAHDELSEISDVRVVLGIDMPETEAVRRKMTVTVLLAAADRERRRLAVVGLAAAGDYVVAPVMAGGRVVGLLRAEQAVAERRLRADDVELLRVFAANLSLVLERALIVDEVNEQRAYLSRIAAQAVGMSGFVDDAVGSLQLIEEPSSLTADRVHPPSLSLVATHGGTSIGISARFTARELDVLRLLGQGATNGQIAHRLTVSESTVKSHVKRVFRKLGASTRAEAIARYLGTSRARGPFVERIAS